jgi:hypothetical protein
MLRNAIRSRDHDDVCRIARRDSEDERAITTTRAQISVLLGE